MKLVGVIPVRNEDWILGLSARVALMWCDALVILNHASNDRTPSIIAELKSEYPGRISSFLMAGDWHEMEHRQLLLANARMLGATHIALIDADEILTGEFLPTVRQKIEGLQPGQVLPVGMPCMWRSLDKYRVGRSIWANRFDLALAFTDAPHLHWAARNGYDHHQRSPIGSWFAPRHYASGGVMHLQFASWRRLTAKHARYKMMERLKYPQKPVEEIDKLYSLALDENGLELADAPKEWWEPYKHLMFHVKLDAEPWQEAECKRLWTEHGAETFRGLNLFNLM